MIGSSSVRLGDVSRDPAAAQEPLTKQRQGRHHPDAGDLAVLGFNLAQHVAQRGAVGGVSGLHLVAERKAVGRHHQPITTGTQSLGLSRRGELGLATCDQHEVVAMGGEHRRTKHSSSVAQSQKRTLRRPRSGRGELGLRCFAPQSRQKSQVSYQRAAYGPSARQ
jgi:hypothetical protein